MKKIIMLAMAAMTILSLSSYGQATSPAHTYVSGSYVPDEVIIVTRIPVLWSRTEQQITGLVLPTGSKVVGCADAPVTPQEPELTRRGMIWGSRFLVKLPAANAAQIIQSGILLRENSGISEAYLNVIGRLLSSPPISQNDPDYATSQPNKNYLPSWIAMGIRYQGWAHAAGYVFKNTSKILVAVLDAGLNFTHQDVQGSYWINSGEIPNNNIDDDNNGFVDDWRGWDFVNSDNDPTDDYSGVWHGTHVFGIIAARNNNANNICGWLTDTMSTMVLKVTNSSGNTTDFLAASGYYYALSKGARIINMSFGSSSYLTTLMTAIATGVANYKAVPVAAVGNTGSSFYAYPASGPNVLTVGNADLAGSRDASSTYSDSLDIMDEGTTVISLSGGSNTASWSLSGTSMASPNAAGKVWWLLKIDSSLTVPQVIAKMRSLGINYPNKNSMTGYGYVVGIDTVCYKAMKPDSVAFAACSGKKALPYTKRFTIVDSLRYGLAAISNDSINTNVLAPGTYTYYMAWKSEPRPNTYYRDTFTLKVTITGTAGSVPTVTVSPSIASLCTGSGSTTLTATTNVVGGSYQWFQGTIPVGTNAATLNVTGLSAGSYAYSCVVTVPATGCYASGSATSNTANVTVQTSTTPTVSITASPNGSVCAGTSVTYTATTSVVGGSYQWYVGTSTVGTGSTTYTYTPSNGDQVKCVLTVPSGGCYTSTTAISNIINAVTTTPVTPAVSIAANPSGAICSGSNVTFTAAPTNGGTTPSYQWRVNGGSVGTNSSTYSSTTLNNGDIVTCVLTSNASCVTAASATSNAITMVVNPTVVPAVSIAASSSVICSGTNVTFTATPTNGGSSPSYQWKVNNGNVGTNSATYSSTTLNNGDVVTCVLTSSATCVSAASVTSNAVTMTVNANITPSVSIAASNTAICVGSNVTFTATPTNGGTTPSYQWKVNSGNVGTNSSTYSSTTLNNGDVVTCVLTSNATCLASTTGTSNAITMTVNSAVSPAVSITANPGSTVCTGTTVTFTATPTNGGSSPSYQWKVNNGNVGTNSPTYVTNTLTNGNIVTCVMTSNAACVISSTATSNGISMSIGSTTPTSTAAATTLSLCNAKADTLSASCSVVGATVQWQKFNGSSWVNIPGAVNPTYVIPAGLAAGSHSYWALFTMPSGCFTQVKDTSNALVINSTAATTPPATSITAQTFLVQQGVYKAIYTATPSTGQYDWYLKVNSVWVFQAHTSTGSWVHNPMGRADTVFAVYWPQGGCYTADSSLSNKLIVQNPNGFADPTGKELQAEIYPNPILNGHTFMVEGLPKGTLLKVMDMMGQTIGQYALHTDGKNTITIEADLAAGYYLVHFTDPQGNGGKGRILVQK